MKSLTLSGVCTHFQCGQCCLDTKMILSSDDIKVIERLGYEKEDFCFIDEEGFTKLKNINQKCFFFNENKCLIYLNRPSGCRFYPIIFDLEMNKPIVDLECPLAKSISNSILKSFEKDLNKFVRKILEERKEL